jgi:hypothetical protein
MGAASTMSDGAVGFLVLVSISVVVAAIGHARSARYALTSVVSGLLSIALFLGIVIARGDGDPFIAIAAVVGAGYSIAIALVVGLPFLRRRSRLAGSGPQVRD